MRGGGDFYEETYEEYVDEDLGAKSDEEFRS